MIVLGLVIAITIIFICLILNNIDSNLVNLIDEVKELNDNQHK